MPILSAENNFRKGLGALVERNHVEAAAYFRSLRSILRYLDVTDGDMEKGQLRCDANVSVRRDGTRELGTRVELKNLNSFRFLERAVAFEIERRARAVGHPSTVSGFWGTRPGCRSV